MEIMHAVGSGTVVLWETISFSPAAAIAKIQIQKVQDWDRLKAQGYSLKIVEFKLRDAEVDPSGANRI